MMNQTAAGVGGAAYSPLETLHRMVPPSDPAMAPPGIDADRASCADRPRPFHHFKIYHELMQRKVREILLVSSPYDAYILEEDGSLASRIINEYHGLNLSQPPRITRAGTAQHALELLDMRSFDLVIAMPRLGGMDERLFAQAVRSRQPRVPLVRLTHSLREAMAETPAADNLLAFDASYVWCCDAELLLAIVKSVEDRWNVDRDTRNGMVRVILLVEDSPLHRSTILPLLYKELVRQTQAVLEEGLNEEHRLLKMRARPKVLLAATYEEALSLYEQYAPFLFAVVSDVRFPREGRLDPEAGLRLLRRFRRERPDLPLLMLSSEPGNRAQAESIPAVFALKEVEGLKDQVHAFLLRYLGFGDFVFRDAAGKEIGRARSLYEFERRLAEIPEDVLLYHARNNHFSNWVMARSEVALAALLHRDRWRGVDDPEEIRRDLIAKVHALRRFRQQGIVSQFSRTGYDPETMDFVRMGRGSLGGKARGLAFISSYLARACPDRFGLDGRRVRIPRTCVVTSDGFDDFIAHNGLYPEEGWDDEEIARRFLEAEMVPWLRDDLRHFLRQVGHPLTVRSSSLLEDAQFRPYAGLYNTYMLPNSHPSFEIRLEQLLAAVKLVYSSTYFASPQAFSRSIGRSRRDSMAVIVQELVGRRIGDLFYPAMSGVARSFNSYPVGPMRSGDGIVHLALGFGKTVVDGEQSLRFSPGCPEHLPQFTTVDDILRHSQQTFYALDMSEPGRFSQDQANLRRIPVRRVEDHWPVRFLSSTYDPQEHRIRDADLPGVKVLTFAAVLKHRLYPLADVVRELLHVGREGMGCEVEIEFAVDLDQDLDRSSFAFLQIRPIVTGVDGGRVEITEADRRQAFLRSARALGHGMWGDIEDMLYVRPDRFTATATRQAAQEIGRLNARLSSEGRAYLLVGPGRWGSADPFLGIPVAWRDISGVGVIVEVLGMGIEAEPSQGSHFFQNITSLGIPYLVVAEGRTSGEDVGRLDWEVVCNLLEVVDEGEYIRHVRAPRPFLIKVDGTRQEGVGILPPPAAREAGSR